MGINQFGLVLLDSGFRFIMRRWYPCWSRYLACWRNTVPFERIDLWLPPSITRLVRYVRIYLTLSVYQQPDIFTGMNSCFWFTAKSIFHRIISLRLYPWSLFLQPPFIRHLVDYVHHSNMSRYNPINTTTWTFDTSSSTINELMYSSAFHISNL
jgi:hypothetical protein